MAQDLRDALPVADGVRTAVVPYDSNVFYPEATPPVPTPCLVIVDDNGSFQYAYFYYTSGTDVIALDTGWFSAGS
ncbi:MAG: hypothetical protein ACPG5T_03450 [Endozoicomonas sp.]